jgi:hypothetical protein
MASRVKKHRVGLPGMRGRTRVSRLYYLNFIDHANPAIDDSDAEELAACGDFPTYNQEADK